MYFKNFPQFLYDFNYDGNKKIKTSVVVDVTRNIRFRKNLLNNIQLFDWYNIVDGETPEIISEKFYGTPEYHWVIMLSNDKYDYRNDFPLPESVLYKHIKTHYNPTLESDDWYWDTDTKGRRIIHFKITNETGVFDPAYLTSPVTVKFRDDDKSFVKTLNWPTDEMDLNANTQYFSFPAINIPSLDDGALDAWLINHGKDGATAEKGVGKTIFYIDTSGRENNPIYFINELGVKVNPNAPGAIPVSGDFIHRMENDNKRKIKIVSPNLIETVLKNYEDEL